LKFRKHAPLSSLSQPPEARGAVLKQKNGDKEAMKIVDRRACLVNEQVTVVMYRFLYLGIIFTIDQSIGPGSDRTDLLRFT
jgi:hypothetical protein